MADSTYKLLVAVEADAKQAIAAAAAIREVAEAERLAVEATKALAKEQAAISAASENAAEAMARLEKMAAGTAVQQAAIKYREQLREINALKEASGQFAVAQRAAAQAQSEFLAVVNKSNVRPAAAAMDTLSVSTGKASGSAINLVRQLNDVGVMAAMGANPLQILAMQGEQIAFAFKEAGGAAGLMEAAAGPLMSTLIGLTPVIVAVGGALFALVNIVDDYTESQKEAKRAADAFKSAMQPMKDAIRDARAEQELLNAAFSSNDPEKYLDIARLSADADRKAADATKGLRDERDKLMEQLAAMSNMESFDGQLKQKRVHEIEREIEVIGLQADELASITVTNYTYTEAIKGQTDATKKSTRATTEDTEAKKRAAEQARELAAAAGEYVSASKLLASVAADSPIEKENLRYQDLLASIEHAIEVTGDQQTGMEALDAAGAEHLRILDAIKTAQDGLTTSVQSTTAAYESEADARLRGATSAVSAVGGGANGLLSALGNAGPYGGLIAGILSLIENLDETLDGITDFLTKFTDQLARLPETVGNFVGDLLTEVLPGIVDAIGSLLETLPDLITSLLGSVSEMIPDLLGSIMDLLFKSIPELIVGLIASLFDSEMWIEAGKSLVDGFMQNFEIQKGEEGTAVADVLTVGLYSAIKGTAASGLDRTQEGLYYLHRDEQVVNRARADQSEQGGGMSTRGRMAGYGGRVTIEIDPTSMAETMTGLSRRGYTFGATS